MKHFNALTAVFLLSVFLPVNHSLCAQEIPDSTDIFHKHLQLNAVVVTGLTGEVHLKEVSSPISVIQPVDLQARASSNIIGAIAR